MLKDNMLDVIDDPNLIDTSNAPEFIKKAAKDYGETKAEDIPQMRCDDFALLVLTKEGQHMPKYPVHNPYYAWAAVESFNKTASKLPPVARVVAATFIKRACDTYAVPCTTAIERLSDENLTSNIYDMNNEPIIKESSDNLSRILLSDNIEKAAKQHLRRVYSDKLSEDDFALSKTASVSGPRQNHYPIYSPDLVKTACEYFERHSDKFSPKDRREFAIKTARKAFKFNVAVPHAVEKYAGRSYANDLDVHIEMRKHMTHDEDVHALYDSLYEKRAHVEPENFAQVLEDIDKDTGLDIYWDWKISDPYYSTFDKQAGAYDNYIHDYGEGAVTGLELGKLAENTSVLAGYFNPDIIAAFERNPIVVFDSMPRPQKMIFVRTIRGELSEKAGGPRKDSGEPELDKIVTGKTAARMVKDPSTKKGQKMNLPGKALKPVLPVGPSAMGVKTPSSRMVEEPEKFSHLSKIKNLVSKLKR